MTIPILILAAGASTRMNGRDKLLEDVAGRPLLRHVVRRAVATKHPVLVALPQGDQRRRAVLDGLNVQIVAVPNAGLGMAKSLRAGLLAAPDAFDAMIVTLADMPEISTDDYLNIINNFNADPNSNIHRAASHDGTPGNPVLLPKWALADLNVFTGDAGARHLLRQYSDRVRLVRLPESHATTDLDTPADWAAWRARNQA